MAERDIVGKLKGLFSNSTALQGGVTTGQAARDRIEDIVHFIAGGFHSEGKHLTQGDLSDNYGGSDRTVSIENAAQTQLDLQQKLDQHVVDENLGISHHDKRGLQPCQRVSKGES
ncbi:MAG: hypothetical protein UT39_C0018G0063 [Candidatus Woesebacteria bacterium GW2011_GWA1_39_21]|uniref:Uncharacterized protein n=1 Tax=Candidatus Woesebacteria bacterium GW2011_GWA1_39_21 TaxID=1618550 RepID=A0A0G0QJM8_9BACT|nr:MAG: hypothetical protein UT39_C0018G0063 [Candidatus Woesebacteria bacterium GW2011_GWA1_39_21]